MSILGARTACGDDRGAGCKVSFDICFGSVTIRLLEWRSKQMVVKKIVMLILGCLKITQLLVCLFVFWEGGV